MQVTNNGYNDPNNLKFDNIIILGVPTVPASVSVTHVDAENTTTILDNKNIDYDGAKKVNTSMFLDIIMQKKEATFIVFFFLVCVCHTVFAYNTRECRFCQAIGDLQQQKPFFE